MTDCNCWTCTGANLAWGEVHSAPEQQDQMGREGCSWTQTERPCRMLRDPAHRPWGSVCRWQVSMNTSVYVCKNYILMMRNWNVFYSGPVTGISFIVCMQPGRQAKRHDAENGKQQGNSGETLWWAEEGERDWHRYKSNQIHKTQHYIL